MNTDTRAGNAGEAVPGRLSIRPQALQAVVAAIAADSIGVPVLRVTARLADRGGALQATVTVPANVGIDGSPGPTLLSQAETLQREVIEQTARLTARTVRVVDVRLAGVFRPESRRIA